MLLTRDYGTQCGWYYQWCDTIGPVTMQSLLHGSRQRLSGDTPIPPGTRQDVADAQRVQELQAELQKLVTQGRDLYNAMRLLVGTEDLIAQLWGKYNTVGTESTFTLTPVNQSVQRYKLHGFSLGAVLGTNGTAANLSTLITTGVNGFVQLGNFVVNFNVPSITETNIEVLVNSNDTIQFVMNTNSGDFPPNLVFYGLAWGRIIPDQIGVLH
jgi:hypothetical protein